MISVTARSTRRNARRRRLHAALLAGSLAATTMTALPSAGALDARGEKPTIVLVHGAWADASSWARVIRRLQAHGFQVVAPANPLRSPSADATYLKTLLETIDGPIVLVGHSYGASVITNAATGDPDVRALVFVNGSVPAEGETVAELAGPDSALSVSDPTTIFNFSPASLPPTGASDVYLKRSTFSHSFATDIGPRRAAALWAMQRPITLGALNEPSGTPAWDTIPSWYLVGTRDEVIPPSAQRAMAETAGATVRNYEAGHLGPITEPGPVVRTITDAASATR